MIGDWVQIVEPCKYAGAIGRIKTLIDHKDDENAYFKVFLKSNTIHIGIEDICSEDIRPIPLTAEILEKNGFEKCNVDDDGAVQYEFGDDNLGIDLWVSMPCLLGAWRKWKGMEKSYNMINEFPIRYVHELQHALRLCGIEKEIEL